MWEVLREEEGQLLSEVTVRDQGAPVLPTSHIPAPSPCPLSWTCYP